MALGATLASWSFWKALGAQGVMFWEGDVVVDQSQTPLLSFFGQVRAQGMLGWMGYEIHPILPWLG